MNINKKTQKYRIRRHLLKGRSISQFQATLLFRCVRLSAIIYELKRKEGLPIEMRQPMAILGRPYAVYSIDKKWLKEHGKEYER